MTVCKFLPILDKNTLLNNLNDIFHIALVTVHSELMKKLDKDFSYEKRTVKTIQKSINIRQSIRKKIIYENDSYINIDLHSLFVENLQVRLLIEL